MYTVTSEIYGETNFLSVKCPDGKIVSTFKFYYPIDDEQSRLLTVDKDGDLDVQRRRTGAIELEHLKSTELKLVGLQVWRGALLLADFLFSRHHELRNQEILELGAGVGLTSIAAAIFARKVVCTDVDLGCILDLIRRNVARNASLFNGEVDVEEFDFIQNPNNYRSKLLQAIDDCDIVVAADVIYDDELTNAFIQVIDTIFEREKVSNRRKIIYVALEKRYVFTLSECDSVAPMYEYFIKQTLHKPWKFEHMPLDFAQYFEYERCKELILLRLTSGRI